MAKLKVNKLILNNVRCFKGAKEFNIRPITFLVGANNTGKSTMLGCFQAMAHFISGHITLNEKCPIDFNKEPYNMGDFTNIVRKAKPKSTEFKLGLEIEPYDRTISNFHLQFTFAEERNTDNPIIKEMFLSFKDGDIRFIFSEPGEPFKKPQINLKETGAKKHFTVVLREGEQALIFLMGPYQYFNMTIYPDGKPSHHLRVVGNDTDSTNQDEEFLSFLREKNFHKDDDKNIASYDDDNAPPSNFLGFEYFSLAPARAAPQRTYETQDVTLDAYGYDIPEQLRHFITNDKESWKHLENQLNTFGAFSDLFAAIKPKLLGKSPKDPFQLECKIGETQATNIADAGYGISQVLPILVTAMSFTDCTLLLQHPEVYLYPKAQASLLSMLSILSTVRNNNFIIETHNTSLIARVRGEILENALRPEDVSLIYLEKRGTSVEVHNLGFDEKADFVPEPPESYDDFYML